MRSLAAVSNGPDTPVMDVSAMRRALSHASWRDPGQDRRKNHDVRRVVLTLERTAACIGVVQERIREAGNILAQGKAIREPMMRALLAARFEELLDSLERVAALAQDGQINLLMGAPVTSQDQTLNCQTQQHDNALTLVAGLEGLDYRLSPIDIRRGCDGLNINALKSEFQDDAETEAVEAALRTAQDHLNQFAKRLSNDAILLVRHARKMATL
jgi:hypothetical protein